MGSYTWTIYRSQISYTDTYGDYKSYRTDWGYDRFFKNTTNKRWYLNRDCSSAKEEFHRQGPDFSNCDD